MADTLTDSDEEVARSAGHLLIVTLDAGGELIPKVVCPGLAEGRCESFEPCSEDECKGSDWRMGWHHGVGRHLTFEETVCVPSNSCFVAQHDDLSAVVVELFAGRGHSPVGVWVVTWESNDGALGLRLMAYGPVVARG